jgi:hypothetical protein
VLESDFSCYVAMLVNYGVLDGWVRVKFDVVGGCHARADGFTPRFWWATFDVVGCCHAHALARPGATGISRTVFNAALLHKPRARVS